MLRLSQLYRIDLGFDNWEYLPVFTVLQAVFGLDRILCTRFAVWIEFFARNSQQFFTTIEPD